MKLAQYVKPQTSGIRDLAEALGVSYETVRRYVRGEILPPPSIGIKIVKITKGKVKLEDLYG